MKNKTKTEHQSFDRESMRYFMALSVRQKLAHLESLNQFFQKHMSSQSREIWNKLKVKGF